MSSRAPKPKRRDGKRGYTLMDAMIIVLILGVLASLALNQYGKYVARARRPEAVLAFRTLATKQREHLLSKGRYAATFDELNFSISGGTRVSATEIEGRRYTYRLVQDDGPRSWYCIATGNIDGDPFLDILAASNPR